MRAWTKLSKISVALKIFKSLVKFNLRDILNPAGSMSNTESEICQFTCKFLRFIFACLVSRFAINLFSLANPLSQRLSDKITVEHLSFNKNIKLS